MRRPFLVLVASFILSAGSLSAQIAVPNAGFEQPDMSSSTQTLHWKPEGDNFTCIADGGTANKGKHSLKLTSETEGHHFFNQEFPFTSEEPRKYRIKCAYRAKDLNGEVWLGARVFDKEGRTITKIVFTLTSNTDQDWTMGEGVFVSDASAAKLRVFGNLKGTGEAWFDEFSVAEIPAPQTGPSAAVRSYIDEYFDIVQTNAVVRDKDYLAGLQSNTIYLCSDSASMEECHDVLRYYTTIMLRDGHSFFTPPDVWKAMTGEGKHPTTGTVHHQMPTGKMLDGDIAYINIPMFISSDEKLMQQYADSGQNIIARFDKPNLKGYIIDVSNNGGGNSLPMVAAVGPLIGDGVCGYSISGDGSMRTRIYRDGAVGWDSNLDFRKANPYQLKYKDKPVAVIYGNQTASSGEVTATVFIGLPNTRSFGTETAGLTTRVDNFEMSDGSYLNLAAGLNADRNKKPHDGRIKPDVVTADTETAIEKAKQWISQSHKTGISKPD